MNKKAAAALGTLGTGSAATATALATQGTGDEIFNSTSVEALPTEEDESDDQVTTTDSGQVSVNTPASPLDKLKTKAKRLLSERKNQDYQMNVDSFTGGTDIGSYNHQLTDKKSLTPSNSLLGHYFVGMYGHTKSFLEIKVTKKTYKNGKGKGTLTGLGSFSHNDYENSHTKQRGFITFNEATTSDKDKKLVLTGGFYTVERTTSNTNGTIKYSKEVKDSDNKTLDKTNFDKYFPKPYWYTKMGAFDKYGYNNGGFMSGASDLDKICGESDEECKVPVGSTSYTLQGEGYGDSGYGKANCDNWPSNAGCDYVGNWSGDINSKSELQGGDHMYGTVGKLRLRDHLHPFYRGSWRPVKLVKLN